ncbi:receptor-type tyrosine-protein phosphatase-like N isoform X2 [Gouania willdenowi]|uniref:receptor-type tyrosine-protein phosphatase-like N isoform X2 n=1 Tax=Gouania willdenowi TaxID=441366 RepID=UPI001054C802|nr:receptor-type tyrosine-protein phosphatase-like N isoform X2 [Gouania willdenowi]
MTSGLRACVSVRVLVILCVCCRLGSCHAHGCLFEKNICPRGQLCSDDGLFGRCQDPQQDSLQYQLSVPLLHRLQELLKDLTLQGLTWRDDITQAIISRELSRVPTVSRRSKLEHKPNQMLHPQKSSDAEMMKQYLDYLDAPPSAAHMPMMESYEHNKFGYQDENQERSLNSMDHQVSEAPRVDGFLQNLLSFYLSTPPSSSSSSSFLPQLDFPLDYSEDFVPQETERSGQKVFNALSGLNERSLQRLALLLDQYGLGPDASHQQENNLPSNLKQLQLDGSYTNKPAKDKYNTGAAAAGRKLTEGSMAYQIAAKEAPPSAIQPVGSQKVVASSAAANQHEQGRIEAGSQSVIGQAVSRIKANSSTLTNADQSGTEEPVQKVLQGDGEGRGGVTHGNALPLATKVQQPGSRWVFSTMVAMACIGCILVSAMTIACLRHHAHRLAAKKLGLGPEGGAYTHQEYQDLCRQHMASKGAFGRLEAAALGAVGGASGEGAGARGGATGTADSRVSSVSSQFSDGAQPSPSSHSSTPSWCEEPAQANMDISTGHMILAYMEDHLRNKDRLLKEWEALCSYQAEPSAVSTAQSHNNAKKNRCVDALPYDHARVKLRAEDNPSRADYINASPIIEHDPRMPAYIATQGPLSHTISDFWQMVWENGCTVIVMMTALLEDGEKQCDRYWPDEGSSLYHIYEVNLVSEHIWCNDFLVRSFYLKNVQTQETRTLTQFHFLSWPAQGIPTSTRPLLDFRRKVNKCYRGRSCPIIVHCSDGTGRTGTYILIDMVLNRMAKGVKEIDIAATLEHIRDQRPGMVRTKDQFEFALTAVAEEVNAILKALPQ